MTEIKFTLDTDLVPNQSDTHSAAKILALAAKTECQAIFIADVILNAIVDTGRPAQIITQIIAQMSALCLDDNDESTFYKPSIVETLEDLAVKTKPTEQDNDNG